MQTSYTDDEAIKAINEILQKYDEKDRPVVKIEAETNGKFDPNFKITNADKVSKEDRMKICVILSRTGHTTRSARSLAAEWQIHILHYLVTRDKDSRVVNLDFDIKTNDIGTIIFTKIAQFTGVS